MLTDWNAIDDPQDEPCTSAQRRSLYALGMSRHFVHKFVKTKRQASEEIARLLEAHARLRHVEEEPVGR